MSRRKSLQKQNHSVANADTATFQGAYYYSSVFPHPNNLERYVRLYPNAAQIIFDSYKEQSEHRRALEKEVAPLQFKTARLGIYAQVGSALVYGATTVLTAWLTPPWVPVALAGIFGLTTVIIYCYGVNRQADLSKSRRDVESKLNQK